MTKHEDAAHVAEDLIDLGAASVETKGAAGIPDLDDQGGQFKSPVGIFAD